MITKDALDASIEKNSQELELADMTDQMGEYLIDTFSLDKDTLENIIDEMGNQISTMVADEMAERHNFSDGQEWIAEHIDTCSAIFCMNVGRQIAFHSILLGMRLKIEHG